MSPLDFRFTYGPFSSPFFDPWQFMKSLFRALMTLFLHPSFCNSYFGHFFTGSQTDPCFLNKNSGADWPGEWTKMVNSIRRFFVEKYLELTVVFLVYFFSNQVICIKSLNIKLSLIYNNKYLPKCTKQDIFYYINKNYTIYWKRKIPHALITPNLFIFLIRWL